MHSSHRNVLAVRVEELSAEEARLLDLLTTTRERLAEIREDLAASRTRLANVERFATKPAGKAGRPPLVAPETFRRVIRELGTFTVSELAAELGCTTQAAKRYLDVMLVTDPPVVASAGRAMGKPIYEYRKPTEAGDAFTAQQRLRSVPNDTIVATETPQRGAPVSGVSRTGGAGMITDKVVRQAVQEAIDRGWTLHKKGDGHFLLKKGGQRVGVAGSPSDSYGSADIVRRMTREAMPTAS